MAKILFVLCLTILVANVLSETEDFDEVLTEEVNAILSYPKPLITEDVLLDVFDDIDYYGGEQKCIRPLRRCGADNERRCCRKLRCGRIIKRCLPSWLVPNRPTTTAAPTPVPEY